MELSTAIAAVGTSASLAAVLITLIIKVIPGTKDQNGASSGSGEKSSGQSQSSNDPVQRPEFERYCESTNTAFGDIKNMLTDISSKFDRNLTELARKAEDHERRIGVIEARHLDYTGDDLRGGGGPRVDRRFDSPSDRRGHSPTKPDCGLRRRKSDPENVRNGEVRHGADVDGIGSDGTELGEG